MQHNHLSGIPHVMLFQGPWYLNTKIGTDRMTSDWVKTSAKLVQWSFKVNGQVEVLLLWQYVLCQRGRRTCYFWMTSEKKGTKTVPMGYYCYKRYPFFKGVLFFSWTLCRWGTKTVPMGTPNYGQANRTLGSLCRYPFFWVRTFFFQTVFSQSITCQLPMGEATAPWVSLLS